MNAKNLIPMAFVLLSLNAKAQTPTATQLIQQLTEWMTPAEANTLRQLYWIGDVTISGVNYRASGVINKTTTGFTGGAALNCAKLIVNPGSISSETKRMDIALGYSSTTPTTIGNLKVTELAATSTKPASIKTFTLPTNMTVIVHDAAAGKYTLTGKLADGKTVVTIYLVKYIMYMG